jgi:hypothetical protein
MSRLGFAAEVAPKTTGHLWTVCLIPSLSLNRLEALVPVGLLRVLCRTDRRRTTRRDRDQRRFGEARLTLVECRSDLSNISLVLKGETKGKVVVDSSNAIQAQTTHRKCRRLSNTSASLADMAFQTSHCQL